VGQVLFVAEHVVRSGHVRVQGLRVLSADVRGRAERPYLVGVEALQGAVTVWNRQPDPAVTITAELLDVRAGTAEAPVRGSGVLVGGLRGGGTLRVPTLSTGEIQPITSHGPSGIKFVNFGAIDRVDVRAPIQTFGTGARGFNFYAGTLRHASFHSIATHGDGSIGIQVGGELPALEIAGDLTTDGGAGLSLVKGVQVRLKAIALSVQAGGHVGSATVGGRIRTTGDDVLTVEIEGRLDDLRVAGGISAEGRRSDAVRLRDPGLDLTGLTITARDGEPLVRGSPPDDS
jgi:hypothetical protein